MAGECVMILGSWKKPYPPKAPHPQGALEQALRLGEICAYYQPQVCAKTGALTGCEALARWHHPQRGLLTPSDFLPQIGACGLTAFLGALMVENALTALSAWDRAGIFVPKVAVNFAQADLNRPYLVSQLAWDIDRFGLTPDRLTVEILETVQSCAKTSRISANIAGLARLGCGIDLDDFGTGHATQAAVRHFAVGRIKIDRRFVRGVHSDPRLQNCISAIVDLGKELGLQTLAEGVESPADLAMLAALGCDAVQGFHIAPPMSANAMAAWIARYSAPSASFSLTA
jgi:EAL domain-containing protein (putative c-di-GMP-specific phosphodiesterase class I)